MAYRDPYAERYGQYNTPRGDYDPHDIPQQAHTYEPQYTQGYVRDPEQETFPGTGYRDNPSLPLPLPPPKLEETRKSSDQRSVFESEEEMPSKKVRTANQIKKWRYATRGALWTQGSRAGCIGRYCCCVLMVTVLILISILLPLALWIRPPNVIIHGVKTAQTGDAIAIGGNGIVINLGVDVSVSNPNYFSITFNKLQLDATYPINNTPLGGGRLNNLVFKSGQTTNFTIPLILTYIPSKDPGRLILTDLATKCGFLGSPKTDLQVSYAVTLGLKFLLSTISPVIRNRLSFGCPLQESDVQKVLAQAGLSIGQLIPGAGGGTPS